MSGSSRAAALVEGLQVLARYLPTARARDHARASRDAAARRDEQALLRAERRIDEADVVSFDLFDTLITRAVRVPEDVHDLVERRAALEGLRVPAGWRAVRRAAEERARDSSTSADVTLAEIYAACAAFVDSTTLARLAEIEADIELRLVTPTRRGARLFAHARDSGRTIVVASDMYLPTSLVERMLRACGFAGWDALIVSGTDGVSKRDGSTYRLLRTRYEGRSIVHIGDNRHSDVAMARREGIAAVHLESPLVRAEGSRPLGDTDVTNTFEANAAERAIAAGLFVTRHDRWVESDGFADVGYRVLGPVLLAFSHHTQHLAAERGSKALYFLAREGRVLQRAYEAAVAAPERLPIHYALLSSRVSSMAALSPELHERDLRFLVKTPVPLAAVSFFTRILGSGSVREIEASLRAAGVEPEQRMGQDEAARVLEPVFRQWSAPLQVVAAEQRRLLVRYLDALGMLDPERGALLVDVGWAGTIQRSLVELGVPDPDGVYVGLVDSPGTRSLPGLHAWIDARRGAREARDVRTIFDGLRVLEVLMAAPDEGSTAAFIDSSTDPTGVEPVRLPLEFPPWAALSIGRAQDEALRFIADFLRTWAELGLGDRPIVEDLGRRELLALLGRPTVGELQEFSGMPFDGSYGELAGVVGIWGLPAKLARRARPADIGRALHRRVAGLTGLVARSRP